MKAVYAIISATLLLFTGAGCICTKYIENAEKTEASLWGQSAFVDTSGNIYIEAVLNRSPLNNKSSHSPLGQRYLILNAPGFQRAIEKKVETGWRGKDVLQIIAYPIPYHSNMSSVQTIEGWYIYPPDILREHNSITLPDYLHTNVWTRYSRNKFGEFRIPAIVQGQPYSVDIALGSSAAMDHQDSWAYPLKILIVPAAIIDVITFPIQFFWFANEVCQIKG